MKDLIKRANTMINASASVEDVHDMLISEGMSEYQAWLTYRAALLLG